jgi:radical SAM protein with 4Fe4S-binding SPASM domain
MKGYPVLKEDIFFAKIYDDSGMQVRIRNTTTEKDFNPTPDTVSLLELCTGTSTVEEIITALSEKSGEPAEELTEGVSTIIEVLQQKGIISVCDTPLSQGISPVKEVHRKYPTENAQIEITNKCNLSCLHCFNNSGELCPGELTTEEILSVIDTLSGMGVHKLTITGGEPLTHPDLFDIVNHARNAPMTVTVFTNGTLLTEDHVKQFKKLNVKFAVSVDSCNPETHDTFRGKKGALQKTLHGLTLIKKAGLPVTVSVSLSRLNKDEIIDTIKFLKNNGLGDYQMAEVSTSGRGIDEVIVTPEEYYQVLVKKLTYEKKDSNPKTLAPKSEGGCGIAQTLVYIKADGTILPCHACCEDMGVGNIRNVDLPAFWDTNETLETLRDIRAGNDSTCKDCQYLPFCDGCIGNAFIFERTFRTYDPYACARQRAYEAVGLLNSAG